MKGSNLKRDISASPSNNSSRCEYDFVSFRVLEVVLFEVGPQLLSDDSSLGGDSSSSTLPPSPSGTTPTQATCPDVPNVSPWPGLVEPCEEGPRAAQVQVLAVPLSV